MPRNLHFPPFELRPTARLLLHHGRAVPLGARAFDVLLALVEVRGELVTKHQLLDRAWQGLVVEEANIHVQVSLLRKLMGPQAIATVPGLGYRFAWAVSDEASQPATPHNLPAERTAFVGREEALTALRRCLSTQRLVTLVGIGGTGKTRLARRCAQEQLPLHPGGVWWVDLAAVVDAQRVGHAVAQATGCPGVDEDEPLQALALPGETAVSVRPMAVPRVRHGVAEPTDPEHGCESVRLFLQSALLAHPDFTLDAANAEDVEAICRELDGLPLAIELAAAQMQVIAPAQLLALLRERFRALGGPRRALARQQTLQAVIQWSWEHLRPEEQRLLSALAVCVGGCDLETLLALTGAPANATAAGADALAGLGRLADLSLISVTHRARVARYRVLETVAQFALEKLGDGGAGVSGGSSSSSGLALQTLRDRHLTHFLERSSRWEQGWNGSAHRETLADADDNQANVNRALDWALALRDWPAAVRLANALFPWWTARSGAVLALDAIEVVLEAVPADHRDPKVAELLCHAASAAMRRGLSERARALALRSADAAREAAAHDAWLDAQVMLARVDERDGRLDEALALLAPVIAEARRGGQDKLLGDALNVLGQVQLEQQDLAAARVSLTESALISQRMGHLHDQAVDVLCLATLALEAGDAAEARHWMRSIAGVRAEVDHRYADQMWLNLCAWLAATEGDWPRAVRAFRVADRFAESLRHGRSAHWRGVRERSLGQARSALDEATWRAAGDAGEAAPLSDAVDDAQGWLLSSTARNE